MTEEENWGVAMATEVELDSHNHIHNTSAAYQARLEALNNEMARELAPAMVFLGLLMVLGLVGNLLVCFVFLFRLRMSTQHFLIVTLALFDLLSCCIGMPMEVADMRYFLVFEDEAACRLLRFINSYCAFASILTLIVIAVDRYRKVCRPLCRQMSLRTVKVSVVAVLVVALLFAAPAPALYGIRNTPTTDPDVHGHDCSTDDSVKDTVFPLIYNSVLFLAFLVILVALSVMYIRMWREMKRHNRYMARNSDAKAVTAFHLAALSEASASASASYASECYNNNNDNGNGRVSTSTSYLSDCQNSNNNINNGIAVTPTVSFVGDGETQGQHRHSRHLSAGEAPRRGRSPNDDVFLEPGQGQGWGQGRNQDQGQGRTLSRTGFRSRFHFGSGESGKELRRDFPSDRSDVTRYDASSSPITADTASFLATSRGSKEVGIVHEEEEDVVTLAGSSVKSEMTYLGEEVTLDEGQVVGGCRDDSLDSRDVRESPSLSAEDQTTISLERDINCGRESASSSTADLTATSLGRVGSCERENSGVSADKGYLNMASVFIDEGIHDCEVSEKNTTTETGDFCQTSCSEDTERIHDCEVSDRTARRIDRDDCGETTISETSEGTHVCEVSERKASKETGDCGENSCFEVTVSDRKTTRDSDDCVLTNCSEVTKVINDSEVSDSKATRDSDGCGETSFSEATARTHDCEVLERKDFGETSCSGVTDRTHNSGVSDRTATSDTDDCCQTRFSEVTDRTPGCDVPDRESTRDTCDSMGKNVTGDSGDCGETSRSEVTEQTHNCENSERKAKSDSGDCGETSYTEVAQQTHNCEDSERKAKSDTGDCGETSLSKVTERTHDCEDSERKATSDSDDCREISCLEVAEQTHNCEDSERKAKSDTGDCGQTSFSSVTERTRDCEFRTEEEEEPVSPPITVTTDSEVTPVAMETHLMRDTPISGERDGAVNKLSFSLTVTDTDVVGHLPSFHPTTTVTQEARRPSLPTSLLSQPPLPTHQRRRQSLPPAVGGGDSLQPRPDHSDTAIGNVGQADPVQQKRRLKCSVSEVKSYKATVIATSVTAVFFLSFLPHLSLLTARIVHTDFDRGLRGAGLVLYNVFLRSYFINSVSNPVIYGVLNARFRAQCLALLRQIVACTWRKQS